MHLTSLCLEKISAGSLTELDTSGIGRIVRGKGRGYALYRKRRSYHPETTYISYSVLYHSFHSVFCSFITIRAGSHKEDHNYRFQICGEGEDNPADRESGRHLEEQQSPDREGIQEGEGEGPSPR